MHHKAHLDWPGIETGSPWRQTDRLSHGVAYRPLLLRKQVVWDVTLCRLVSRSQYLGGWSCLHMQSQELFLDSLTLKMRHLDFSKHRKPLAQIHSVARDVLIARRLAFCWKNGAVGIDCL